MKKTPTPPRPVPASLAPQITWAPGELAEMRSHARRMVDQGDLALMADVRAELMFTLLMCRKVMENPPGGRSGATAVMRAMQESIRVCERLAKELEARREEDRKKANPDPDSPGADAVPQWRPKGFSPGGARVHRDRPAQRPKRKK